MTRLNLRHASLSAKALAVVMVLVTLMLLLLGGGLLVHTRANVEREMTQRLALLGSVIARNVRAPLAFRDPQAATETLQALAHDGRIRAGGVYDASGALFAAYTRADEDSALPATAPVRPDGARDRIALTRAVELKGETIGWVSLIADTSRWSEALDALFTVLLALFATVLVVGILIFTGLQRVVSRPIEELAQLMRRIARERDYGLRATKRGNDEIGVLVDGLNDLLDEIAARRAEAEQAQAQLKERVRELDAEVMERRRAEAELRGSREQLQDFIDNANVGMHWLARDGTVLWANRYQLEMLGYAPEEYIGHRLAEFLVERGEVAVLERLAREETVENLEARLRGKDGAVHHLLMNSNIHRENGEFVHVRCFARDITVRKQVEDALRRSEERYRTLVAATTSLVFGADRDGAVTQRLPSWEDYTGQSFEAYRGDGWVAMVHEEDRERVRSAWTQALSSGESFEAELRLWHRRTRRYRYCTSRIVPLRHHDGAISEWIGTMTDIDDRKRAEEQFRIAVEGAPNAMLMINPQGRIVLVNRQLENLFGYRREELLGQSVELLVPERARRAHPGYRAQFFAQPQARAMGAGRDLRGRHKDGREIPVEIGLSPFATAEGAFVLASVIDISQRKRNEEDLRRYTDELQRSNRELGQFAYVASHDLQEPLRAISGCVQLLQQRYRDKLDTRANELIEHTVSGALRMQALINDLLSYSRVSTRARPFERCDLSQPLRQALANLEYAIKESGAEVTVDPMPSGTVDPTQLTQLFQNLIGNAIKFRAERAPRVHVGVEQREGGYVFCVSDNGIGIETQYVERIFGVFQRLHNRNKYPGNGIGLAICRKIVERHNGRIWVESVPGQGSTFYFTLPTVSVHNVEPSERYGSQRH